MIFSRGLKLLALTALAVLVFQPMGTAQAQDNSNGSVSSDFLGQVVVTAGRVSERLREVSTNVTIVTAEQIEQAAVNDMADVLRQQGFWIYDTGAGKTLQIRGMSALANLQTSSTVLILINGKRTGITEINQVPVGNIERVEIIRGPAAVQYGTAALGGVVNIITKRGSQDKFSAVLETGIGSFGLNKTTFNFTGGYQGFDFSGSARYYHRDSISVRDDIKFNHTSLQTKSIFLESGYTFLDKHRIGVSVSDTRSTAEWPGDGFRTFIIQSKALQDQNFNVMHTS
ncbi:MAG: TonB-dependent receptor plug domain-containing protein, partial [Deltaproteobacteria bacterium]|nr:TonB-dependent receptor plug domain-containing protein [Deltaproteobacteria bacterium]